MSLKDKIDGTKMATTRVEVCQQGLAMLNREFKVITSGASPDGWPTNHKVVRQEKGWKITQFTYGDVSWLELTYSGRGSEDVMKLMRSVLNGVYDWRPDVGPEVIWIALNA